MAMMIRNTHRLLTIRIDLKLSRSGGQLQFATFHGTELLRRYELAAEAVGIRSDLSVSAYRGVSFQLPADLLADLAASLHQAAAADEPMWLQVGPSGGQLGVVPWERLLQPVLQAPLLRIPNFLADPVFLTGPLRLALVVSSPRAKSAFPVDIYAQQLLQTVQAAVPQGTSVDLFADLDAYPALQHISSRPGHRLTLHPPAAAASFGEGGTSTSAQTRVIASPWLRWIIEALQGRGVDAVHFVCPGYFRRDQGALAVARSPADNTDREWSHMICSDELVAFLDQIAAWAVAFTPPFEDVWAMGVRLLADRLVWQRPGALMVHQGMQDQAALAAGYRFLFADHDEPPPATPSLMVYTHPKRMPRYRGSMTAFEAVTQLGVRVGREGEIPEQLEWLARKDDREALRTKPASEGSAWRRSAELQVDQLLARLGDDDSPERRGALEALAQVRNLIERSRS